MCISCHAPERWLSEDDLEISNACVSATQRKAAPIQPALELKNDR